MFIEIPFKIRVPRYVGLILYVLKKTYSYKYKNIKTLGKLLKRFWSFLHNLIIFKYNFNTFLGTREFSDPVYRDLGNTLRNAILDHEWLS